MKNNNIQIMNGQLEKVTGGVTSCDPALALAAPLATCGMDSCDPAYASAPLASTESVSLKEIIKKKEKLFYPPRK